MHGASIQDDLMSGQAKSQFMLNTRMESTKLNVSNSLLVLVQFMCFEQNWNKFWIWELSSLQLMSVNLNLNWNVNPTDIWTEMTEKGIYASKILCRGGARVGDSTYNICLCLFILDKSYVYLDVEHIYEHIKWETVETCALFCLSTRHESNERGNDTGEEQLQ